MRLLPGAEQPDGHSVMTPQSGPQKPDTQVAIYQFLPLSDSFQPVGQSATRFLDTSWRAASHVEWFNNLHLSVVCRPASSR